MANANNPRGFIPYQNEGNTLRSRQYTKGAAAIYQGDLLVRVADGTVQTSAAGETTNQFVGIAAHYAAASATEVAVYDDPDATYVAQCDGTTAYAVADNGSNVDIAAGTPVGERSGQLIDMNTKAATATLPFKVIGLAPKINDAENGAGVNADLLVKLNDCERGAGAAGI